MRKFLLLSVLLAGACEDREPPPPPPEVDVPWVPPSSVVPMPPPVAAIPAPGKPAAAATGKPGAEKSRGVQVQVPMNGDNFSQPRFGFTISAIYEKQKPIDAAPFHAAGGEWTFFDATTVAAVPAGFTVGLRAPPPHGGDVPFSFGDLLIIAADRDAATRFVTQFAGQFHTVEPRPAAQSPLAPFKLGVSVFGRDLKELPGGGFSGDGGGHWTATKLFPQLGSLESEVFFNFSLVDKRGEFAEKDPDYRKSLVAVWSQALRDGIPKTAHK